MRWTPLVVVIASACALHNPGSADTRESPVIDALADLAEAPGPSARLDDSGLSETVTQSIASWFDGHGTRRLHVQIDRPMLRPGESVWVKTWSVATRGLQTIEEDAVITYELLNPRGEVVESKKLLQKRGAATNDFEIPADAAGGKWTLRATAITGETHDRDFIVSAYEAPRIRKDLEFVREAYGAGDEVEALVELKHPTRGPLKNHTVKAMLQVDGETVFESSLTTDDTGAVLVSAMLPDQLSSSDGLLTVLVEDGGITESISRSVPIVVADLRLAFFPEGGDLVQSLPSRVYFEGTDRHGEPADVEGVIEDETGARVTTFSSLHDGMGRFDHTPVAGKRYFARVTAPAGIEGRYELPTPADWGCTLRSFDDVKGALAATRVAVRCSEPQQVLVSGMLRETPVDVAAVHANPVTDAVVYLQPDETLVDQQGAMRVTVFDWQLQPLAERLVYRNPGKDLQIEVTPDRERFGPRDAVELTVKTTDPSGRPVAAELALSVVDDRTLSLADDEEGHMLSQLYLSPDLIETPDDPAYYFDDEEALAARGLDLVMGTRGWRHFEWEPLWDADTEPVEPIVLVPPAPRITYPMGNAGVAIVQNEFDQDNFFGRGGAMEAEMMVPRELPRRAEMPMAPVASRAAPQPMPAAVPVAPMAEPAARMARRPVAKPAPARRKLARAPQLEAPVEQVALGDWGGGRGRGIPLDMRQQGLMWNQGELGGFAVQDMAGEWAPPPRWAPVRKFPAPDYASGFSGTRTDFRDTVHWAPNVATNAKGEAKVSFYLSDAVTTFRVTAEGLGGGYAGHGEATLTSALPVSIATKLPAQVSSQDRLLLPITVSSTRDSVLNVSVSHDIHSKLVTVEDTEGGHLQLDAQSSATHWLPMTFGHGRDTVKIHLEAEGGGLSDILERELEVVPAGFPRAWSNSGELTRVSKHSFTLDKSLPGSLRARVAWHPSTVASLVEGMEGLIRTPGGCFEQTSSTNWPNVAILRYLDAHDGDPRLKVQSSHALNAGYAKLTGYQVSAGGFETWGSGPGKEALSAFGLLQFADMADVFKVDPSILDRDVQYLLSVRDGQGGYRKTGESAHGYGSAPKNVLDGFITMALVKTGHAKTIPTEIAHQASIAKTTKDPYVLAMATRTLLGAGHGGARAAAERLAAMQAVDGSFPGAESSITRSYEANLMVESTALATLALLEGGAHRSSADRGAAWLVNNRQGAGTWGATQATALALGALTTHAEVSSAPRQNGELIVEVNGKTVDTLSYQAFERSALTIEGWEDALVEGDNSIVLRQKGGQPLPFTIEVQWSSDLPASEPDAELGLTTTLDRTEARMGETVRLTAQLTNRTDRIQPSPMARIGIPAGLEAPLWQLKELQERGEIAYFETRPREVTLYWDGIHIDETHEVNLDLLAAIPGDFTGPASSAWPYYDDDDKAWVGGLEVAIGRASGATK